ncbi:MAG: ribonuclease H-like domain-containing protein [Aquificaceae bacterium]
MGRCAAFDIETYCPVEEIEKGDLNYLQNRKEYKSEEEFKKDLSTNPYVAYVISFALFFPEENKGEVYYLSHEERIDKEIWEIEGRKVNISYNSLSITDGLRKGEEELIKILWDQLSQVDKLITFYGKTFDIPFVKIRTMMHNLKPKNFFVDINHIDLKDLLGIQKKNYTLDFISRRMGISLNKEYVDGSKVDGLFRSKKYKEIAQYNLRDVLITGLLYERVKDYIYEEHIYKYVQSLKDLKYIEQAIDNDIISSKEMSILIDFCKDKQSPTDKQKQYLKDLIQNVSPEDIYSKLRPETIKKMFMHFEE